jgi:hypothetical protein
VIYFFNIGIRNMLRILARLDGNVNQYDVVLAFSRILNL